MMFRSIIAFIAVTMFAVGYATAQLRDCDCTESTCFTFGPGHPHYSGYCCLNPAALRACTGPEDLALRLGPEVQYGRLYVEWEGMCAELICTACCGGDAATLNCTPGLITQIVPGGRTVELAAILWQ